MSKTFIFSLLFIAILAVGGYLVFIYEMPYQGVGVETNEVQLIGYRGFGTRVPENSVAALEEAQKIGLHGVHINVQQSVDGRLVVFSDSRLERLTDRTGYVEENTLEALREMDIIDEKAGYYPGQTIMSLDDLFEKIGSDMPVYIELRSNEIADTGIERILAKYITDNDLFSQVWVMSFNPMMVWRTENRNPDIRTTLLMTNVNLSGDGAQAINNVRLPWFMKEEWTRRGIRKIVHADMLGFHASVEPLTIMNAREAGYPILFWRADGDIDLQSANNFRPDVVITAYPLRAQQLIHQ